MMALRGVVASLALLSLPPVFENFVPIGLIRFDGFSGSKSEVNADTNFTTFRARASPGNIYNPDRLVGSSPLATFTLLSFLTSNLIITTPSLIFTFDTFTPLLHNHNQPHSLNTNTMFAKQIITSILLAVAMTSVTAAPTVNERDIAIKGLTGGDFHLKQNDVDLVSLPLPRPSSP